MEKDRYRGKHIQRKTYIDKDIYKEEYTQNIF